MKKLIFILFLLFTFSCKKENSFVENSNNWQIYTDVKYFPISIIEFLEALYGRDFKLANPNENFNITDVKVYPNKPHQQLCFLANKENIWRLVYIQGGVGKSNKFYEFELNKDTISKIKKGWSFENIRTNDSLEFYLKKGKINFEKIKIKYE